MASLANQSAQGPSSPTYVFLPLQMSWKNKSLSSQMEGSQWEKTLIQQVLVTPSALES